MKDISDIIGWIIGGLTALVFFGWRYDKKETDDRIDTLYDRQREGLARMAVAETKIDGIQEHYMQTLDDIKMQQLKMAEDVTAIKVAVASMPKRRADGD